MVLELQSYERLFPVLNILIINYQTSQLSFFFPLVYELQRAKQEVLSLRRENSTLDAECHEKEKHINQLQTKVAVLEQEIKDKDQLVLRTKEAFDTIQEQKVYFKIF